MNFYLISAASLRCEKKMVDVRYVITKSCVAFATLVEIILIYRNLLINMD